MSDFEGAKNGPGIVPDIGTAVTEANMQSTSCRRYVEGHEGQKPPIQGHEGQCPIQRGLFTPISVQENGGMKSRAFLLQRLNYIIKKIRKIGSDFA